MAQQKLTIFIDEIVDLGVLSVWMSEFVVMVRPPNDLVLMIYHDLVYSVSGRKTRSV